MKKLNKLAQLAKIERYIAQFQKLSNIHERATTDFLNKFEYCWKDGYETARRDILATQEVAPKLSNEQIAKFKQAIDATSRTHANLRSESIQSQSPQPLFEKEGLKAHSGWIVQNWRRGWMWLSNWMFAVIAWVAFYGIPPELLALIPEANRKNVIPILSALGVICRFIDQSRKKPLPPVQAVQEDA